MITIIMLDEDIYVSSFQDIKKLEKILTKVANNILKTFKENPSAHSLQIKIEKGIFNEGGQLQLSYSL